MVLEKKYVVNVVHSKAAQLPCGQLFIFYGRAFLCCACNSYNMCTTKFIQLLPVNKKYAVSSEKFPKFVPTDHI